MNTKVIYTCLTGNYDTLLQPEVVDNSFDFICFSNDFNETKIGIWEIRKIPFETNDNSRLSRYPKILSHKVLQDYEYSIYIDANIQIVGQEIYNIANQKIKEGVLIAQVPHPFEKCIYDDIKFAFKVFKIDFQTAKIQYQHLKSEGYPKNYGLFENNLIFRKHNVDKVITIMTEWWNEYLMYSKRDQFSLMYIYWKNNFQPVYLFDDKHNARNVKCLKFTVLHKNEKIKISLPFSVLFIHKIRTIIMNYLWK